MFTQWLCFLFSKTFDFMYVFRMASFHRKCAASLHREQMLKGGGVGQGQSTVNFSSERPATSAIKTQNLSCPWLWLPSMETRSSTALVTEGSHTVSQNTCHPPAFCAKPLMLICRWLPWTFPFAYANRARQFGFSRQILSDVSHSAAKIKWSFSCSNFYCWP